MSLILWEVWSACWLCYSRNIILWAFLYFNGSDWTNGIPTICRSYHSFEYKNSIQKHYQLQKCKYNPSKKLLKSTVFFSQLLHIICQRINGVPNISKSQSYLQMIDFTVKCVSILPIDGAVISLLDVVVLKKKCGWVGKATENGGVNKQFYPPLVSSLWQHCNYAIPNRHLK